MTPLCRAKEVCFSCRSLSVIMPIIELLSGKLKSRAGNVSVESMHVIMLCVN